jgi:D-xylose transport system substrate-binding protein
MGLIKCHKSKIILFLLFFIILLSAIFVFNFNNKRKISAKGPDKIKIGLSLDSLVVERWQYDRDIFLAKAKELGADVIVQNASNDSDEQINQIKYLISQNVNVLVIIPNDSEALDHVVAMAKKKGIKVICYDRIIRKAGTDLYVSFDNEKVGELMAEAIVKKVPQGNYIIINGNKKDYNAILFNQGFKDILGPFLTKGDIKIVGEVWARNWKEDDAYNCVEQVVSSGTKIDGIIAANDDLAEAAIQILSEHRMAGKVVVVGEDAALAGCQRVVEGLQLMTVYKPIRSLAQDAAEASVKLARGEKVKTSITQYDGLEEVPVLMESSIAVDKDNMVDVVVKNNFHRIEDIYRNIPQSNWPKVK